MQQAKGVTALDVARRLHPEAADMMSHWLMSAGGKTYAQLQAGTSAARAGAGVLTAAADDADDDRDTRGHDGGADAGNSTSAP